MKLLKLALAMALFLTACGKTGDISEPPENAASAQKTADQNAEMGWRLFHKERQLKSGQNVLISPYSIQTAMQMAANGAQQLTLEELMVFLRCGGECNTDSLNAGYEALRYWLEEKSGHPQVTSANGFFYDPLRVNVDPGFININQSAYACQEKPLNFSNEPVALAFINDWVKESTNNKIDKILERITSDDVAFLINALHFKADWATGFVQQMTIEEAFTRADGSTVMANFVNGDRNFTFKITPQFQLVDIPFRDSTYSMSLIQPGLSNSSADWPAALDATVWKKLYEDAQYSRAITYFPRMKLAYKNDLIPAMKALGLNEPFSGNRADFSRLGTAINGGNIFISQVQHKTVLEVDEKGAEGAAVTAVGFAQTSLPPVFRFNKPFVLVLRHIPTNTMMFVGYVEKPQ